MKVLNANIDIETNKPFCPECKDRNYKIVKCNLVNSSKGKVLEYIVECKYCFTRFKYLKTIPIGKEEVFIEDDVKEIKEDQ